MPKHPTAHEIRLESLIPCLTRTVTLLGELNDTFGPPFIHAITNTTESLLATVQKVQQNKAECIELTYHIYEVISVIATLHIKSETPGSLPQKMLNHVGKFTETLHKIHTFVEAQQERSKIKHFFRQSEMKALLKDCHQGLESATEVFKIEHSTTLLDRMKEIKEHTEKIHQELLELISTLSGLTSSDSTSLSGSFTMAFTTGQVETFVDHCHTEVLTSSNSFSLLPAKPKIFHGRESELEHILKSFKNRAPRVAILGVGGIGKTSLAAAVLHHPDIAEQYAHRFFVGAESATTAIELAAQIGQHIGLKPGNDLRSGVAQYFSTKSQSLLILDNLETAWEPTKSRGKIEEFLALLTEIEQLGLIITMRGSERPAQVRWTHPFLLALKPLPDIAARQIFMDIAEDFHDPSEINKVLNLTDNLPLAVDLMAHLVDSEGCSSVLQRWETEKTGLLSKGWDRKSSLDASISLSLSSPRFTSMPGAKDLLSVLSILPNGLSDIEIRQCQLPIKDVIGCKAMLLRTSLAYSDDKGRFKSLVPIREYTQHFHPPSPSFLAPLRKHFHLLLDLYKKYTGAEQGQVVKDIDSNQGNLQQILTMGLHPDNHEQLSETISCILSFNAFRRVTGQGHLTLMESIPNIFPQPCNHELEANFIVERLRSLAYWPADTEILLSQGAAHFREFDNPDLESNFYSAAGLCYASHNKDAARELLQKALVIARSCKNTKQQCISLRSSSYLESSLGNYAAAEMHAYNSQRLAQLSGDPYNEAAALYFAGTCRWHMEDYKTSAALFERARELLKLCGLLQGHLYHLLVGYEVVVHLNKSEYTQARHMSTELVRNTSVQTNPIPYGNTLLTIAEIDVIIGAPETSVHELVQKAADIFDPREYPREAIFCDVVRADLYLRGGNLATAAKLFHNCLQILHQDEQRAMARQGVSRCLEKLSDVNRWNGIESGWSSTWPVVYLAYAQTSHEKLALHKALLFLGDTFLSLKEEATAQRLFSVALEGFTFMDVHRSRAQCMLRLGDISKNPGDLISAEQLWRDVLPLFKLSLQDKDAAQVETRLVHSAGQENPVFPQLP